MKKLIATLLFVGSPILCVSWTSLVLPHVCLILFIINPFLVLLCVGPFAGLLPPDLETIL